MKVKFQLAMIVFILIFSVFFPLHFSSAATYRFERMWPTLKQPWYFLHPFGIALDSEDYVYVADSENNRIRKFTKNGQFISEWGKQGGGAGEFSNPTDIAADRDGFIYIVDNGNHRIQKFSSNGAFIQTWGSQGNGDGEFDHPFGIAADRLGYLYVTDSRNHRIQKLTDDGRFVASWSGERAGDLAPFFPRGIAAGPDGFLFVADNNNDRVQKFSADGIWIAEWGSTGSGNGEFLDPDGIAVAKDSSVYVSDLFNSRIQKFSSQGTFIAQWGNRGNGPGEFQNPVGMATDAHGNLYVADEGNNRVQKFSAAGRVLAVWGNNSGPGFFNLPGGIARDDATETIYVADTDNHRIQAFSSDGAFLREWGGEGFSAGKFFAPEGLAVNDQGQVIVADTGNNRIQVFEPDGTFVHEIGGTGTADGQFSAPFDVAVAPDGNILVLDTANHRVQKLGMDGTFLSSWGSSGTAPGQFDTPKGIAVDDAGNIYVADTRNHRIQKFDETGQLTAIWGDEGVEEVQFDLPFGLDVGSDGNIYIADSGNYRIQVLSSTGQFIAEVGERGNSPGQFQYPSDIVVDGGGKLFITDGDNHRVQVFQEIQTESIQKAILVAGGGPYPGNNLWDATRMCANFASSTLRNQGIPKDRIRFLSPETELDLDGNTLPDDIYSVPTRDVLRQSIEQWAGDADLLVLYMADHGGDGRFRISENEILEAAELDGWLDAYTGTAVIILDACDSGGFLNALAPEAGQKRIIITSTNVGEDAYFINQGGISFSTFFWNAIFNGRSVGDAFAVARTAIGEAIDFQSPQLIFSAVLTPENIYIGGGTTFGGDAPTILSVSPEQTITDTFSALLFAEVTDDEGVERVWAVIRPPMNGGTPTDDPFLELPTIELSFVSGNRFEGRFDGLTIPGAYDIAIYAMDASGNTSSAKRTAVMATSESTRKVIIVAGGDETAQLWPAIRNGAQNAYETCIRQGYTDENIYFLSPVSFSTGIDGLAVKENLEYAIQEWAAMQALDLVVYLIGEGSEGNFQLNASETITPLALNGMFDAFQAKSDADLAVVLDYAEAGRVVTELESGTSYRRIVISSVAADQTTLFLPEGDISFSSFFWTAIREGENVREAFLKARDSLALILDAGLNSGPQMDDSGNGIGNERVDGNLADQFTIGFGIKTSPNDPVAGQPSPEQTLQGETTAVFSIDQVSVTGNVDQVWAAISPPSPDRWRTDAGAPMVVGMTRTADGGYAGSFEEFTSFGIYRIAIQANDADDNNSMLRNTTVYQSQGRDVYEIDDEISSAKPIILNDNIPQHHNFHETSDQDWVQFAGVKDEIYTIRIEDQEIDIRAVIEICDENGVLQDARTTPSNSNGLSWDWRCPWDGNVFIRVTNANDAGASAKTGYYLNVFRPIGPFAGFISGTIASSYSGLNLDKVRITTDANASALTRPGGGFFLVHEPGSFSLTFSADGYEPKTISGLSVSEAGTSFLSVLLEPLITDNCPSDPNKTEPGICGCGFSDRDSDSDGTPDCLDVCPSDPFKQSPGVCGCGASDRNSDDDGVPDCLDGCPDEPDKTAPGACGCGRPDTDENGNGVIDCLEASPETDECPDDPEKRYPGLCGCGVPDTDTDGDGSPDCMDLCPGDPAKTLPGACGCGVPDADMDADGIPDCVDGNHAPERPVLLSPSDGGTAETHRPLFETDLFFDQDGDAHAETRWQIGKLGTDFFPPVLDITSRRQFTSFQVPEAILESEQGYMWRAAFIDERGTVSQWAEPFTLRAAPDDGDDENRNGVPDAQESETDVDLNGDGLPDALQEGMRALNTISGNFSITVKVDPEIASFVSVSSTTPPELGKDQNRLEWIPMGVLNIKATLSERADKAIFELFFSRNLPEEAEWYFFDIDDGWQNFSEQTRLEDEGRYLKIEIRDGGFGDVDGAVNGVVVHSGTIGVGFIAARPFPSMRPNDDVDSTGCFIESIFLQVLRRP